MAPFISKTFMGLLSLRCAYLLPPLPINRVNSLQLHAFGTRLGSISLTLHFSSNVHFGSLYVPLLSSHFFFFFSHYLIFYSIFRLHVHGLAIFECGLWEQPHGVTHLKRKGRVYHFHLIKQGLLVSFPFFFALSFFLLVILYYIPYLADNRWSGGYFVNIVLTWRHDITYLYLHWAFHLIFTASFHQFLEKCNVSLVCQKVLMALAVLVQTIAKAQPSTSNVNDHRLTLKSQLSALCRLRFRTTAEQEGPLTPWVARICP